MIINDFKHQKAKHVRIGYMNLLLVTIIEKKQNGLLVLVMVKYRNGPPPASDKYWCRFRTALCRDRPVSIRYDPDTAVLVIDPYIVLDMLGQIRQ